MDMDCLTCLLPDPATLRLDHLAVTADGSSLAFTISSIQTCGQCPLCSQEAVRVHSQYQRTVADLPWAGLQVQITLTVRRFFCDQPDCPRRIFTERLPTVLAPWARRTYRLARAQQQIGLALGGAAGTRLAVALAMLAGVDLLLQLVRQAPLPDRPPPRLLGVDDWAWRKGQRYGTIVVDLETHRPIDLLPDRLATTLAQWLRDHPGVEIITRDRSGAYAEGAQAGAPQALQVADRFHLLKNMSEVLLQTFQQCRGEIEDLLTARHTSPCALASSGPAQPTDDRPTVQPELPLPPQPTPPQVRQHQQQSQRRRIERYQTIQHLDQQGWTMVAIADQLGITRKTVRRYLDMPHGPAPQRHCHRRSILDPYKPYLFERWNAGCYTAMQLFREVQEQGFRGTDGTVRRYLTQVRKASGLPPFSRNAADRQPVEARTADLPSLTTLCWRVLRKPETREPDEEHSIEQLRHAHADVGTAITLAEEFAGMIRQRQVEQFDSWLERASRSGLPAFHSFATGLRQDEAAVRAALSLPSSNGPTEGHINRLKCLKRQMYGRAKLDLLRQRLLAA